VSFTRPRAFPSLSTFLLVLLLGPVGPARAAEDLPPMRSEGNPLFASDLAISLDAQGTPAVSASVSIPFSQVQWVLAPPGDRRMARVEISIAFQGQKKGRAFGDLWERSIAVPTFAASRSPNTAISERRTFQLPPGRYEARVVVRDLNGGQRSEARQGIEVPDYSKIPVGLSDLELGLADSSGAFAPVPTRVFGLDVTRLGVRLSLFDRRGGDWPRQYELRWRILDEYGIEVSSGRQSVQLARSAEPIVVRPGRTDLFVGRYSMVLELLDGPSKWRVDRSFEVEESGPPRGRDFVQMLEPLGYVAAPEEVQALRVLKPEDQARGWEEFWRRRDPTPDTQRNEALIEFIRRVRHAERSFQGFGPGWRSDMGRIYIRYGPPGQTESRPASSTTPHLEVWYYTNPAREFVFADREGFGRFVLVSPSGE
jgi:GWxTD domain-containing protein